MTGEYDGIIEIAVSKHLPARFDWRVVKAQIMAESSFRPRAVSPQGAQGLMQIMPGTWNAYKYRGYKDPFDPEQSIMTGCRYIGYLYGQWSWPRPEIDRVCLALASYNCGLGHMLNAQKQANNSAMYAPVIAKLPDVTGRNSAETSGYVAKIMSYWTHMVLTETRA